MKYFLLISLIFGIVCSSMGLTVPDDGLYTNTLQANALCSDIHAKCENNQIPLSECVAQIQACREANAKKQSDVLDKVSKQIDQQNQKNTNAQTSNTTGSQNVPADNNKPAWHFGPP